MSAHRPPWFQRATERFLPEGSSGADRQLRIYLAFVFALFAPTTAVFAWLDWIRGEHVTALLVGVICLTLLASLHTLRGARDIRWGYRVLLGVGMTLLTVVVYLGGGGGYAILWYYAFPAGFYFVFGAREGTVWLLTLVVPGSVILFTDVGASYPTEMAWRFLVIYALVSALALGLQRSRDALYADLAREKRSLEEALARVRTLQELLPMCAWCGKVRDDDGYWSQIEDFLSNETGTQVSHGICEECAQKLNGGEEPLDGSDLSPGPASR